MHGQEEVKSSVYINMEYYSVIREKVCHLQQHGWTWSTVIIHNKVLSITHLNINDMTFS